MARPSAASIDDVIRSAMEKVMKRVSAQIARAMAEVASQQIDLEISRALAKGRSRGKRAGRPVRRAGEISRWAADRRARRVPKFVIEMTNGLDTKKKIVARYGEGAVFEKGKALPKAR
jgi:DNA invertase Pin-like site-specific DNA recombinase